MKHITINNNVSMPQIGLGTFLIPHERFDDTIREAYRLGYRQFDTAWRYHNERWLADALKKEGVKRQDVFITTKLNADGLYWRDYQYGRHSIFNIRNFKSIRRLIQESFDNLQTEYIDLFLIHWPWPMMLDMWRELERFYKDGRIRAIGVSNFLIPHLQYLLDNCEVRPVVNQFEISPLNTQKELIAFCRKNDIAVEAMSTFSHYRSVEPRTEIINNPTILPIAEKLGKSVVQVVLRWLYQQDIIMIPKTTSPEFLRQNISIEDFSLSDEEMAVIDSLDRGRFLNYIPLGEQQGLPRKYREWDGFKKWNEENPQRPLWKILLHS